MRETRRSQIARAILEYIRQHLEAQDTLEGITQWWLPEEMRTRTVLVSDALTELVAKGLMLEHKGKDAQLHYRVNKRRLKEIEEYIREKSPDLQF
ncbi:MAG: hypothetical protein ND895_07695 [Pyrinomonadaceae bacterium]|nr:hypothetical protein [Pyrinomonadaceae bacterium]